MTTFEPGASVVLTQGLRSRPASTAFLASSAAPIMTDGLEVLVQEVMAAMTTEPWSTSVWCRRPGSPWAGARAAVAAAGAGAMSCSVSPASSAATGSDAGKVSAMSSSSAVRWT